MRGSEASLGRLRRGNPSPANYPYAGQAMRSSLARATVVAAAALVLTVGCGAHRVGASAVPKTTARPGVLFGRGPEADSARRTPLVRQAPVRMLTSWFNSPNDLSWMRTWRPTVVLPAYKKGFALHLIVWDGGSEGQLGTPHGQACGRAYALSQRFLSDMRVLARVFAGRPSDRFYVTLFAEFQTYPCKDNAWSPDAATTAYYEQLKDQYRSALAIFHSEAPNALVSLGWGGWQAAYDTPEIGGGRSLFKHFADVMHDSGFQSFQSLDSPTAARDAKAMTRALKPYGPVMLAFYKPLGPSPESVRARVRSFLSPSNLSTLRTEGLFALSFMDTTFLRDPAVLRLAADAVNRSSCSPCRAP
jgi:hypothetical protein